jgi:hypothetical protein
LVIQQLYMVRTKTRIYFITTFFYNRKPYLKAISQNIVSNVEALLNAGADINIRNYINQTALEIGKKLTIQT